MNYYEITPGMTIGDLITSGIYGTFADYIFTDMTPDRYYVTLREYGFEKCGFEQGLHRMEELAASDGEDGASYVLDVYDEEERLASYDKARVKLLHFPAKNTDGSQKPYAVVIPGGGFNRQWGFIEGEAIAAALNEMGYPAFVLYYRVKQEPLMPKPLEDMHHAVRYIEEHAAELHVAAGRYMIGGFSAGATVAEEMGSNNFGWNAPEAEIPAGNAGTIHWCAPAVPKPELIFLGYTACTNRSSYEAYCAAEPASPLQQGIGAFLRRIGGPFFDEGSLAPFELCDHIDGSFPKTYLVANEDDGTVPVANTKLLDARLTELGVQHITKIGRDGGHSFGLGIGLEVEGWLDECVKFWQGA